MQTNTVRNAIADDVAAIFDVRTSVTENHMDRAELEQLGITETSVAQMIESTHGAWCVDVGDALGGFAMVNAEEGVVFALFVRPKFERMGIGSALLDKCVEFIRSKSHELARLTTDPGTRAFEFYQRQGWTHVGEADNGEARFELRLRH